MIKKTYSYLFIITLLITFLPLTSFGQTSSKTDYVDIVYESLSYTPPFYKGKALNPSQGVVIITAIPHLISGSGEKIPAEKVIYNWKKNGVVMQSSSGVGKNYVSVSGTVPIRDVTIEVTVSSADKSITAESSTIITHTSPKIVFYENNPIYGIMFNKAIANTIQMMNDEFSLLAIPFFFSVGYTTTPDLDYSWSMNGKTIGNMEPKNSFTTRLEKEGAGTANINLKITNKVRIFQFISSAFNISFNKQ